MKNLLKIAANLLKGGGKGIISPITEGIALFRKIKASGAAQWLDTNKDGKVTIEDIENLQWETIGKLLVVGVLLYLAIRFDVIHLMNQLGG